MTEEGSGASPKSRGKRGVMQSRYDRQFRPEYSRLYRDPDLLWVTPLGVRYIVGIVGLRGAGKSAVASYLAEKRGFEMYSLSRIVREAAEDRGVPVFRRDLLQDIGDELRAEHHDPDNAERGDGAYLARRLLRRIHARHHTHHLTSPSRLVIGGFKHPDEVRLLRRMGIFRTALVTADDDLRADRALRSGMLPKEKDPRHRLSAASRGCRRRAHVVPSGRCARGIRACDAHVVF